MHKKHKGSHPRPRLSVTSSQGVFNGTYVKAVDDPLGSMSSAVAGEDNRKDPTLMDDFNHYMSAEYISAPSISGTV
ncbi:hypothetical protein UFOVP225_54 [uncultured Caudovirales phage]|uniref:Uncharacterized protein n=1 Tax=uncultured Caudovirales phage TaxID=2100421 RepID=A0A6J5L6J8_9CAUD|nr:hypothetical protein UFOVP113_67 [uncultured Caudovirales phage]CAB5219316.1 hypothetical protein UFOVP225_54 [uncultured Caudovirales phage]